MGRPLRPIGRSTPSLRLFGGADPTALTDMLHSIRGIALASFILGTATEQASSAPQSTPSCQPQWLPTMGSMPGTNAIVQCTAVFDDGTGPALYVGGPFTTAGGVAARHVAKWDGSRWSPLGSGTNQHVDALTVFDDGTGPALYAGGNFSNAGGAPASFIAKWNGVNWSPVGGGLTGMSGVRSLVVYDDGSGPALVAGGAFSAAGGVAASSIAKWNGSSWSPLGSGLGNSVSALTVFDDGSGPALYAGGSSLMPAGGPATGLAKWNGSTWSSVGGASPNNQVLALTVFDDGAGPALYAGGYMQSVVGGPAYGILKWDGANWSTLGSGMGGLPVGTLPAVFALRVHDDGSGSALYAGGMFTTAGGVPANDIAKWNGTSWSGLAGGLTGGGGNVYALGVFDDGHGSELYAGGQFLLAVGPQANRIPANRMARWNGTTWSTVGSGITDTVTALIEFDDGGGSALHVGGLFTSIGGVAANHVAKWDGSSWTPLAGGTDGNAISFAVFDDGSGPALFAATVGGTSNGQLLRWNGASWSVVPPPSACSFSIRALAVSDDGTGLALFAAGVFANCTTGATDCLAKWNGSSWSVIPSTLSPGFPSSFVAALTAFDDGTGPALYVSGLFPGVNGVPANNIARWNGVSWSALASGVGPWTTVMAAGHDSIGPALYTSTEWGPIERWSGASWSMLPAVYPGISTSNVSAMVLHDDGTGVKLVVGGPFATTGGTLLPSVLEWSGSSWQPLGSGLLGGVQVMAEFDDGSGPALAVGGSFQTSPAGDSFVAKWGDPCSVGVDYCNGDGSGATCPCANHSNANDRAGCLNSLGSGGKLSATGRARISADSLVLDGSGMPNGGALYFQGTTRVAGGVGAVFGDGLRCAAGSVIRLGTKTNVAGNSQYPAPGDVSVSAKGLVVTAGTRVYQVWYRDAAAFCTVATFNTSNGVQISWAQ